MPPPGLEIVNKYNSSTSMSIIDDKVITFSFDIKIPTFGQVSLIMHGLSTWCIVRGRLSHFIHSSLIFCAI